jgi:hypothetical protein
MIPPGAELRSVVVGETGANGTNRAIRFYAIGPRSSPGPAVSEQPAGVGTEAWLLVDDDELAVDGAELSGHGRRRTTVAEVGFAPVLLSRLLLPVATRWTLSVAGEVELRVDGRTFVGVAAAEVPAEWLAAAQTAGHVWVVCGAGFDLEADHPADALRGASEAGAAFGAIVLLED